MDKTTTSIVSIIVPCYNYGHYLAQTLENIIGQEYQQWECLVIDDGSTDNTAEVGQEFMNRDNRIKYFYQQNQGLSAARNHGLKKATGKYLQFLDSDDFIHAKKVASQVKLLEADPLIDLTYGRSVFFFDDDINEQYDSRKRKKRAIEVSSSQHPVIVQSPLSALLINNIMEVNCALIRKSIADKVGFFDETYKSYEDWQYWIRMAIANAIFQYAPVKGTESYIRCGHASMMTNKRKLVTYGIQVRKYLHPYLTITQKLYNLFRLYKLYTRQLFNIY